MKELMIHVERIVRPVNAAQGRKLRMRTELLAHLQATLDEELNRSPREERSAIERAKLRLGEPFDLTRKLQQTVPIIERMLLCRLPISRRLDHCERQSARSLYGNCGAMTFGHVTILSGLAILAVVPLFIVMYSALKTSGMHATHNMLFFGAVIGSLALLWTSYRFVFTLAGPDHRLDRPGTLRRGATVLALQIGLTFFVAFAIASRSATLGEVVTCGASTVAQLAVSTLIARRVDVLRRPYDEWLTLNITE